MASTSAAVEERGYTNLLAHLRKPDSTLSLQTVQAALTHYLAHVVLPYPTPLTASAISSPFWALATPHTSTILASAYHHAIHLKVRRVEEESRGVFSKAVPSAISDWIRSVITGLRGGRAMLRLSVLCGLLRGLDELSSQLQVSARANVEEEAVVALEDLLQTRGTDLNAQLTSVYGIESDVLRFAAPFIPLIASSRLRALNLPNLTLLCSYELARIFNKGKFLEQLDNVAKLEDDTSLKIDLSSAVAQDVLKLAAPDRLNDVAPISKVSARAIKINSDLHWQSNRLWRDLQVTQTSLLTLASSVETAWRSTIFCKVESEENVADDAKPVTAAIWTILKPLLFSTVMISQAVLSAIMFIEPDLSEPQLHADRAADILDTFARLAFIIARFGGVHTQGAGFSELKRAFFGAVDVLALDARRCDDLARTLAIELLSYKQERTAPMFYARLEYSLACIEQLMPVLRESTIEGFVVPLCYPYLSDIAHRSAYELAHSVMLAIFTVHTSRSSSSSQEIQQNLIFKLIPFYTDVILKNSNDDQLNTAQHQMAYGALVRSAGLGEQSEDCALAWLCTEQLLSVLNATPLECASRRSRLLHTLIALIPNVPTALLPRLLASVDEVADVEGKASTERRKVALDAAFTEIQDRLGDAGKEIGLRWWHSK